MIPAGRLQDSIGPRWVATLGGILTGCGCIIAGVSGSSLTGFIIGFGILAGIGIGFGYASATPPAVKWFPAKKTGMIAGIVVSGFGLASVYIAPLATKLLRILGKKSDVADPATGLKIIEKGVSGTMIAFGVGFLIVVTILSQLLKNPPIDRQPSVQIKKEPSSITAVSLGNADPSWREILCTYQFYILWMIFFAGSAAGLTFISIAQDLGKKSLGELAFFAVVILAIGNAGGRILAGIVSDIIGRQWTLFLTQVLQAVVLYTLYLIQGGAGWLSMMLIVLLIGANYGSNLSLFPSATKDYFGLKNFGLNYGLLFTAWGAAGLIAPWANGRIKDVTGSNDLTYFVIISLLLTGAALTFVSRAVGRR
jgi:MFS family permease